MPLVLLIPAYRPGPALPRLVERMAGGPFAAVIVVDDGSTDGTLDYLRSLGNWLCVRQQANRGPGAARNAGMREARGEYLAFLDSDDRWAEDKLALQLAAFAAHPEIGICFTRARFVDAAGQPTGVLSGAPRGRDGRRRRYGCRPDPAGRNRAGI